jgi:hypothetical protein
MSMRPHEAENFDDGMRRRRHVGKRNQTPLHGEGEQTGTETVKESTMTFTGAKVFTATKAKDREELGDVLTRWLRDNPKLRVIDKIVTQSSDNEFHCLSITIFYDVAAA